MSVIDGPSIRPERIALVQIALLGINSFPHVLVHMADMSAAGPKRISPVFKRIFEGPEFTLVHF